MTAHPCLVLGVRLMPRRPKPRLSPAGRHFEGLPVTRLGAVLVRLAASMGSAQAVADAVEITGGELSRLMRNAIPTPAMIVRLCRAFPKERRELFGAWEADRLAAEREVIERARGEAGL